MASMKTLECCQLLQFGCEEALKIDVHQVHAYIYLVSGYLVGVRSGVKICEPAQSGTNSCIQVVCIHG